MCGFTHLFNRLYVTIGCEGILTRVIPYGVGVGESLV